MRKIQWYVSVQTGEMEVADGLNNDSMRFLILEKCKDDLIVEWEFLDEAEDAGRVG